MHRELEDLATQGALEGIRRLPLLPMPSMPAATLSGDGNRLCLVQA